MFPFDPPTPVPPLAFLLTFPTPTPRLPVPLPGTSSSSRHCRREDSTSRLTCIGGLHVLVTQLQGGQASMSSSSCPNRRGSLAAIFLQLHHLPRQSELLYFFQELLALFLFLALFRTVSQYNKRTLRDYCLILVRLLLRLGQHPSHRRP